ncbi:MAG: hypothetical protein NTV51_09185 [Verrucomicrobia bacterium]|nr:hypothetical protein [Verrucomicrobiota bacterium]
MAKKPKWTVRVSRALDTVWHVEDFASDVARLCQLLVRLGYQIPKNSSLAHAETDLADMVRYYEGKTVLDLGIDQRPVWRRAISLADLAHKILAVEQHPDFEKLQRALFPLLLVDREHDISLFSTTRRENEANNKLFELFVGASLMRFMQACEFENPKVKKGSRNPDFIGHWRGKKWGIACKAMHSANPKSVIDRIFEGIKQIKRSGVDAGLVMLNAKNLVDHNEVWRAEKIGDEWHYKAFENIDDVYGAFITRYQNHVAGILLKASGDEADVNLEAQRKSAKRGRQVVLDEFFGTNARPFLPVVWLTVVPARSGREGVLAPNIFRFLTCFAVPEISNDEETDDFFQSLSVQ